MSFQKIDLRELSRLQGPEWAFVSLYASTPDGLRQVSSRAKRVRAMLQDDAAELEHFEESMKMVDRAIEENPLQPGHVCIFASWALDFLEGCQLEVEVPEILRLGPTPYIRPLAELQDEFETFIVVLADNRSTSIQAVTAETALEEERVRGDVKNAVKVGGWSQKRYDRRRRQELKHYSKEIAEALERLRKEHGTDRIVLLGSQETIREIEENLPQHTSELIVGRQAVDLGQEEPVLINQGFQLYLREERRSEERLWDRIRNQYLGDGLAAVGPTEVLKAALAGRVEAAVVTRDCQIAGVRCRECENVKHGTPDSCQVCGSKSLMEIDLVNEVARQLELTDAELDFVDEIPSLSESGHLAALLRY